MCSLFWRASNLWKTKIKRIKTVRNTPSAPKPTPTHPCINAVEIFMRFLQRNLMIGWNIFLFLDMSCFYLQNEYWSLNIMHIFSIACSFSSKELKTWKNKIYPEIHKSHEWNGSLPYPSKEWQIFFSNLCGFASQEHKGKLMEPGHSSCLFHSWEKWDFGSAL